jgi:phosphatidylglycerophosphatase A
MDKLIKFLATGLGLGLAPIAPGTFGTLLGSLIYYFVRTQPDAWYWRFVAVVAVISILIAHQAEKVYKAKDCQKIVIDEVAGVLLCYAFVPYSLHNLVWGFILFRLFDIAKIFPANYCQDNMPGGLGVVADDLVAGCQAGILLLYSPVIMAWVAKGISSINHLF